MAEPKATPKPKGKKSPAQVLAEAKTNLTQRGETLPTGENADNAIVRRDRFVRLAEPRTRKALGALSSVGHLFDPGYTSTAEEREKIINALNDALTGVIRKARQERQESQAFSL